MKKKKYLWHKENKPLAYKDTGGKCSKCGYIGKFSIHHKSYQNINGKSVYDYSYFELKELKIVEVICHSCHTKEHLGDNLEPCAFCGAPAKKSRTENLNLPIYICKKCFREKGKSKGKYPSEINQLSLFNNEEEGA